MRWWLNVSMIGVEIAWASILAMLYWPVPSREENGCMYGDI
jgi:hypothetical protein